MRNALVDMDPAFMRKLRALDRALVGAGWPPLSAWWLGTFSAFVAAAVRQLVLRCGRRGGKSTSLCRFAVAFALTYDMSKIPPGDVGIVGVVSVSKDEANQRLRTIKAQLDVLGVKYRPIDGGIELVDRAIAFKVFAATLGGVVGGTWILAICDEVARWKDNDTGKNPASEVLASLRPTMATQRDARIFLSSSPLGTFDAHFDAFEQGDTAHQRVAHAPTWVANPTLTEEETRADEPDETVWLREYAAIPQADAEASLLSEMLIDRATRGDPKVLPPTPGHYYTASIDPAHLGNAWTLAVGTQTPDGKRRIVLVREWRGSKAAPLVSSEVFREIRSLLAPYGLKWLYSDQFSSEALKELARQQGLTLIVEPWNVSNRAEAFEGLRTLLLDQAIELPPEPQVKTDLLGIRKIFTRNGVTYDLAKQGARHSDYAPAIAKVVMHTRRGKSPQLKLTAQEQFQKNKRQYLEDRRRQSDRQHQRGGRAVPLTHRRWGRPFEASWPKDPMPPHLGDYPREESGSAVRLQSHRLRAAREDAELTTAELAEAVGKPERLVVAAEAGEMHASVAYVARVMAVCKLPEDWAPPVEGD